MESINYINLDLEFEPVEGSPTTYRVEVSNAAASQKADLTFTLPFSDLELENIILKLGQSSHGVRSLNTPEANEARNFGSRLFESVFTGVTRDVLVSTLSDAEQQGQGVRLRLRLVKTPELINIPWEFLYSPTNRRFFTLSDRTPLIRYLDLPERIRKLETGMPLRILAVIANPRGVPPLDVEREWRTLNTALSQLSDKQEIVITRLEKATLSALRQELRRETYHILHFVGHGDFDEQSGNGVLLLEDDEGFKRSISGPDLGVLLYDVQSLRLVVLNICEGGRTSRNDPFAGTAQSLVQQGIPAVVAMQFPITDEAAIIFSREFYQVLAEDGVVDTALAHARQEVFAGEYGVEWGTPVLYLRASDGRIFDLTRTNSTETRQPPSSGSAVPTPAEMPAEPVAVIPATITPPPPIPVAAATITPPPAEPTAATTSIPPSSEVSVTVPAPPLPGGESTTPPAQVTITATKPPAEPTFKLSTVVWIVLASIVVGILLCVVIVLVVPPPGGTAPTPSATAINAGIIATPEPASPAPTVAPTAVPTEIPNATPIPTVAPTTGPIPTPAIGVEELLIWRELRAPLTLEFVPLVLDVSPDGTRLAVGGEGGELAVYDIASGTQVYKISAHLDTIWSVQYSPGGRVLLTSSTDGLAKIWRADTGQEVVRFQNDNNAPLLGAAFSPDGTLVAIGTHRGAIKIWRISDAALLQILGGTSGSLGEVQSVSFSPDGRVLASTIFDDADPQVGRDAFLWSLADNTQIRTLTGHRQGNGVISFSPDGNFVASGSGDETIIVWDARTGETRNVLDGHTDGVLELTYQPQGLLLAALSSSSRLMFWRTSDGVLLRSVDVPGTGSYIDFFPNGQALAIAAEDRTLQFWGDPSAFGTGTP